MRLYLTGLMGSGKSTVGPRVADELGYTFVDLDEEIEEKAGCSIRAIFEEEGEAAFRALESDLLRQTATRADVVVALGGGALVDDENRAFAREHGRVVYLQVTPETVVDRVGREAEQRPLLQDAGGTPLPRDEMRERVEQMLSDRASTYRDAHVTVPAGGPVSAVVESVVKVALDGASDAMTGSD